MGLIPAALVFASLLGCTPDGDPASERAAYRDALRSGACEAVPAGALADDCWIAAASKRPESAHSEAERTASCARVTDPRQLGECYFTVAELLGEPALCLEAAPFADDCALHVVSIAFAKADAPTEAFATEQIARSGLAVDDPRPWSAYYREVLGRVRPLDRSACAAASPDHREACEQTALALFADRLNQARDRKQFTCVDGAPQPPWPDLVAFQPDPAFEQAMATRGDLCKPRDVPR